MNDPMETTPADSQSWWTQVDDWSREMFATTRRAVIGATVVAVIAVGVGLFWINGIAQRQRNSTEVAQIAGDYAAEVRAYDLAVTARATCLSGVEQLTLNRGQWNWLQDILNEIGGGASEFGDRLNDGPLLVSPAPKAEDCGEEPAQPKRPTELD